MRATQVHSDCSPPARRMMPEKTTMSRPPQKLTHVACLRCWRASGGASFSSRNQSRARMMKASPGMTNRLSRKSVSATTARPWPSFSSGMPKSSSLLMFARSTAESGVDDFHQGFDCFLVVGQALDQRGAAGDRNVHSRLDQGGRIDQQAGADHFFEVAVLECAEGAGDADQALGEVAVAAGFADQDRGFTLGRREVEAQRDETLAGRGLEALEQILVAGVVGDDQHEIGRGCERLAGTVDRQDAAV